MQPVAERAGQRINLLHRLGQLIEPQGSTPEAEVRIMVGRALDPLLKDRTIKPELYNMITTAVSSNVPARIEVPSHVVEALYDSDMLTSLNVSPSRRASRSRAHSFSLEPDTYTVVTKFRLNVPEDLPVNISIRAAVNNADHITPFNLSKWVMDIDDRRL